MTNDFFPLREDLFNNAAMHIGQAVVSALEAERQAGVIEAQAIEQRGIEIMDVNRIASDVEAVIVGLAKSLSAANAAAGEPHCEAAAMMITAVGLGSQLPLAVNRTAELASPDDQRLVEQSALLQISYERGTSLIDAAALQMKFRGQVVVLIPAAMIKLDEPHAPLDQPPRQQTVRRKRSGATSVLAVQLKGRFALGREVRQLWHGGLHSEGGLVLRNASFDFDVAEFLQTLLIQSDQRAERSPARFDRQARWVLEEQHRLTIGTKLDPLMLRREKLGSSGLSSSAPNEAEKLVKATTETTTAMQDFMGDSEIAGGEFEHSMPRIVDVKLVVRQL